MHWWGQGMMLTGSSQDAVPGTEWECNTNGWINQQTQLLPSFHHTSSKSVKTNWSERGSGKEKGVPRRQKLVCIAIFPQSTGMPTCFPSLYKKSILQEIETPRPRVTERQPKGLSWPRRTLVIVKSLKWWSLTQWGLIWHHYVLSTMVRTQSHSDTVTAHKQLAT